MNQAHVIKRLALLKNKPDYVSPLSVEEIAGLILDLLTQFKELETAIKQGRLQGKPGKRGKDAYTPQPDKDYLALPTAKKELAALAREIEQSVRASIRDGKDGLDAIITDEQIEEAATRARAMIELPDFQALITQEPTAIRDSLELLQGDERLEQSAIKNLTETLAELQRQIASIPRTTGGGGSHISVQENGTTVAKGNIVLNFGTGVTATESQGVVTITAAGGGGGSNTSVQETPTGDIDGVNTEFTLSHTPVSGTLILYLNGQFMHPTSDYTVTDDTITFVTAPDVSLSGLPFTAIYEHV